LLFLAVALPLYVPVAWAQAPAGSLEARVEALEAELRELKAELAAQRAAAQAAPGVAPGVAANALTASPGGAPGAAAAAATTAAPTAAAVPAPMGPRPPLTWFGYGELNYSRPRGDPAETTFDLSRFVLGFEYRFDERTRLASEVEIEHAVSSSSQDDPGEVEVEQAYVQRDLGGDWQANLGLFLIPSGLLNENHEPTRFYGVFRNFVETSIIPTTWREGGAGLRAATEGGWRWDLGLTTGFDLSKWDPESTEGLESPLGSIHQELALARAAELSMYTAVNYTGISGLRLGASVFSGGADQDQPGFHDNRVTLWEAHARWQNADWELSALYASGHISGTAQVNLRYLDSYVTPTLIPEDFYGWYLEGAWRGLVGRRWPLVPFLRYEQFNTGSAYARLPSGLAPAALALQDVYTYGLQFEFARGVVLKADYVDFTRGVDGDRFDLGLGYEF
jgi:hypothetical protein